MNGKNYFWMGLKKTKVYFGNGVYDFKTLWNEKYKKFIENCLQIIKDNIINKKFIINIDVIIDHNDIYLMEINPRPGIAFPALFSQIKDMGTDLSGFLNKKKIGYNKSYSYLDGIEFLCQIHREIN